MKAAGPLSRIVLGVPAQGLARVHPWVLVRERSVVVFETRRLETLCGFFVPLSILGVGFLPLLEGVKHSEEQDDQQEDQVGEEPLEVIAAQPVGARRYQSWLESSRTFVAAVRRLAGVAVAGALQAPQGVEIKTRLAGGAVYEGCARET